MARAAIAMPDLHENRGRRAGEMLARAAKPGADIDGAP